MGILVNKYTRSLFNFVKYGVIVCILPAIINYAALNQETQALNSHGLPYDIGFGQKLFLSCKGKGLPTVIAEAPIGANSDIWIPLQAKLSEITKVCIYDRAGLGLSERPVEPKVNQSDPNAKRKFNRGQEFTLERMVEDLKRLISSSSEQERPLMLIGSELGSLITRFYTQIYEDNISHLILINPLNEDLFKANNGVWESFWYNKLLPKYYGYALGSTAGVNRMLLMTRFIQAQINQASDENVLSRQKYLMCNPKHMYSLVDELANLNETLAQMKLIWTIKQFPANVSVSVLSSSKDTIFSASEFMREQKLSHELSESWQGSLSYLKKRLHPNSESIDFEESIYDQLVNNPQRVFEILNDKILKWRKTNVSTQAS